MPQETTSRTSQPKQLQNMITDSCTTRLPALLQKRNTRATSCFYFTDIYLSFRKKNGNRKRRPTFGPLCRLRRQHSLPNNGRTSGRGNTPARDLALASSTPPWFTMRVWHWASTKSWETDPATSKGTTTLELLLDFVITTGLCPPVHCSSKDTTWTELKRHVLVLSDYSAGLVPTPYEMCTTTGTTVGQAVVPSDAHQGEDVGTAGARGPSKRGTTCTYVARSISPRTAPPANTCREQHSTLASLRRHCCGGSPSGR